MTGAIGGLGTVATTGTTAGGGGAGFGASTGLKVPVIKLASRKIKWEKGELLT